MFNNNYYHHRTQSGTSARILAILLASLLLAPLLAACTVTPREPLSNGELTQRLTSLLDQRSQQDHFSGTVLLAKDGVPILARGYGMADEGREIPNTVDTVYFVASVTKMLTSVAIGQLIEQGKLRLDDPISTYLPDYPAEVARKVTIANLLTHSSGIPDFFVADPEKYRAVKDSRDPQHDLIPVFADKPLNFEPGSRYEYSNSNFLLLGAIIERVSRQGYYDYVREHVLAPAGMHETGWEGAEAPAERLALRYTRIGPDGKVSKGGRMVVGGDYPTTASGGAYGGGYTTVGDLLKFLTALRQHTLLGKQTTSLLFTDQIDTDEKGARQAYGFVVHQAYGQRAVGHGGDAEGVANHAYMYPGGYDLILLSNYDNSIFPMRPQLNDLLMR